MNKLQIDKQVAIISALVEGNSIRSTERMTGVHRDTILRLLVKIGNGCGVVMDQTMRNLPCNNIQVDEIWSDLYPVKRTRIMQPSLQTGMVKYFPDVNACVYDYKTLL
jgi:hypothetical protein